ncbi:modification methylase PaeR7I [Candidatus Parcubacteria bacterium]|nr:MAG: modification methylase PaeR7I [Candidatus Parcubacteria bacterium]
MAFKKAYQSRLFPSDFSEAVENYAQNGSEERGAVFTKLEVVEFILDLVGYTADKPLHRFRLIEPSFGQGDFLFPIVNRLLASYQTTTSNYSRIFEDLSAAIRAVEVHTQSIANTQSKLLNLLKNCGVSEEESKRLIEAWLIKGDFLLVELSNSFTHAVGNPPYVRQELIPDVLLTEYRKRYSTIYDRADLYVPFIERCLDLLEPSGTMGFICSDRWMKNKYGGPLRAMISEKYRLKYYVDMVDTPAFHSDVTAYPAITIISREGPGPTRIAHRPDIQKKGLLKLAQSMKSAKISGGDGVIEVNGVSNGREPWILRSFDQLALVRRLEKEFPLIEEAGCKIGIGVATGADKVFIGPYDRLNVEPDRKLPLVGTKDIESGKVNWRGLGVINPFNDDGSLVNLARFPKLAGYFKDHSESILKRNCAKKNPQSWYRTIDRIYPDLMSQPKLLIPDIKGGAHIVYENGKFYPHHNLYFITSQEWNLKALQAVLRSGIAKLFVSTYSTQMRGGYLRFQAQYLRRIRLPSWKYVPESIREALNNAAQTDNIDTCNRAVFELYRLSEGERQAIGGTEI